MEIAPIAFDSDRTRCAGQAYLPEGPEQRPCVILCTGFGGTQDTPSIVEAARTFAEAGYIALTFDYRNFGTSQGEPRQLVDIRGQLNDIRAAIQYARSRPDVDRDLVMLWGTSLGGGHVVTVAANDPRIAAVVAQVPFNGFPKKVEGRSVRSTLRLLVAMVRDRLHGWLRLGPYYIPAVGEPNTLAVMASSEAAHVISGMDSPSWQNKVAPRVLLDMMRYKPGDHAARLSMPVLACLAELDLEARDTDNASLARRAALGEVRSYPVGHFDIYRPEVRQRVLADQVEFLNRALPKSARRERKP